MRILLVTQYFWPESFVINDLVRRLATDGHIVTVLTGKPNYPDGNIFQGYQRDGVQEELFVPNVRVMRVPLRPRRQGGALNLVLNYASFVWSGLLRFPSLVRDLDADVVLVYAPSPITSTIPAILLKYLKRTHLALWVQDLWPESLAATGFVRNKAALGVIGWMVRGIYACCDTLLIQSKAFHAPVARYAADHKIVYYPNSMADAKPLAQTEQVPDERLAELSSILDNHFCIVFAGNIGTAQAIETIVEAAVRLQDLPELRIVLVGSGSMLDWVQEECKRRGLTNVVLAGRFPMHVMPTIFSRSAALLVTLRDEAIFSYTIPSKVQAYLAAGRPILAAINGEGARIVREANAGLTCPAQDPQALADSVRELYAMSPAARSAMGESGRKYFLEHFEMDKLSRRLIEILAPRAQRRGQ